MIRPLRILVEVNNCFCKASLLLFIGTPSGGRASSQWNEKEALCPDCAVIQCPTDGLEALPAQVNKAALLTRLPPGELQRSFDADKR
jgi:hypothetical protein